MLAEDLPGLSFDDIPFRGGEVVLEEKAEIAFPDEADPGRIFLVHDRGKVELAGDSADVFLLDVRKREKAARDLGFVDLRQEIGLVLRAVEGLPKIMGPVFLDAPGVMAHGDRVEPVLASEIQKRIEFDVFVAKNIRVGGTAPFVFLEEIREHVVPIFLHEIAAEQGDPEFLRDSHRVLVILFLGALPLPKRWVAQGIVIREGVPISHETPDDFMPFFLEKVGRDGAVDPAAKSNEDFHLEKSSLLSRMRVNGPSFSSETTMSAWKTPPWREGILSLRSAKNWP